MRLFRRWTKEQCLAEIQAIEANLAAGINAISNPTQGSITYRSAEEALSILSHLEARVDEIDGVRTPNPIRRGGWYGVRPW